MGPQDSGRIVRDETPADCEDADQRAGVAKEPTPVLGLGRSTPARREELLPPTCERSLERSIAYVGGSHSFVFLFKIKNS
jgi:hypothetical protein